MNNVFKILSEKRSDGQAALPSAQASLISDIMRESSSSASIPGIDWNPEKTEKLIDLFEAEVALWNTKHPRHLDREERRTALLRISKELKIPPAEIEKKLRGLRSYYSRELSKIQESLRGGSSPDAVYVSPWVFFLRLSFLSNFVHPRPPKRNPDLLYLDHADSNRSAHEFDSAEDMDSPSHPQSILEVGDDPTDNMDSYALKQEQQDDPSLPSAVESQTTTPPPPPRKKSRYAEENSVNEGFLYPSIRMVHPDSDADDEDLCFGRHVALSLKKMNRRAKEFAKLQIQQVLYECYVTHTSNVAAAAAVLAQHPNRTLSPSPSTSSDYSSF